MVMYDWVSGLTFGRLTLTGKSYYKKEEKERRVEVICICGRIVWKRFEAVKKGRTASCGCLSKDFITNNKIAFKHGLCSHPLWRIWSGVKKRCYYKRCERYPNYGGRGIKMYESWLKDFNTFYKWALGNSWENGLSLERINVNGDYEPNNCKFIELSDQASNRTTSRMLTIFNETKCLMEWVEDSRCIVKYSTALRRLYRGWNPEQAITLPARDNGFYKSSII